jgi:hypothetical protein
MGLSPLHAIPSRQIAVDELEFVQILHSFGNFNGEREQMTDGGCL